MKCFCIPRSAGQVFFYKNFVFFVVVIYIFLNDLQEQKTQNVTPHPAVDVFPIEKLFIFCETFHFLLQIEEMLRSGHEGRLCGA